MHRGRRCAALIAWRRTQSCPGFRRSGLPAPRGRLRGTSRSVGGAGEAINRRSPAGRHGTSSSPSASPMTAPDHPHHGRARLELTTRFLGWGPRVVGSDPARPTQSRTLGTGLYWLLPSRRTTSLAIASARLGGSAATKAWAIASSSTSSDSAASIRSFTGAESPALGHQVESIIV